MIGFELEVNTNTILLANSPLWDHETMYYNLPSLTLTIICHLLCSQVNARNGTLLNIQGLLRLKFHLKWMTSLMLNVPCFCVSTLQSTQFMSVPFREDPAGPAKGGEVGEVGEVGKSCESFARMAKIRIPRHLGDLLDRLTRPRWKKYVQVKWFYWQLIVVVIVCESEKVPVWEGCTLAWKMVILRKCRWQSMWS